MLTSCTYCSEVFPWSLYLGCVKLIWHIMTLINCCWVTHLSRSWTLLLLCGTNSVSARTHSLCCLSDFGSLFGFNINSLCSTMFVIINRWISLIIFTVAISAWTLYILPAFIISGWSYSVVCGLLMACYCRSGVVGGRWYNLFTSIHSIRTHSTKRDLHSLVKCLLLTILILINYCWMVYSLRS